MRAKRDVLEALERALTALSQASRSRRLHRLLNLKAGVVLDRPAYVTLACLEEGEPLRVSDLAEALSVDVSTTSRLVDQLVANGLVETGEAPPDRRVVVLRVSQKGKRLLHKLKTVRRQALSGLVADWGEEEKEAFARHLSRFVASLERFIGEKES